MTLRLVGLLAFTLAVAGCSRPVTTDSVPRQTVDGMTITLSAPAPHTGDDTLTITLADAATGAAVGNANITAQANMLSPRLSGSEVSGRAQGNGVYFIPVRLGIATRYSIALKIDRPGRPTVNAAFPLEAAQ